MEKVIEFESIQGEYIVIIDDIEKEKVYCINETSNNVLIINEIKNMANDVCTFITKWAQANNLKRIMGEITEPYKSELKEMKPSEDAFIDIKSDYSLVADETAYYMEFEIASICKDEVFYKGVWAVDVKETNEEFEEIPQAIKEQAINEIGERFYKIIERPTINELSPVMQLILKELQASDSGMLFIEEECYPEIMKDFDLESLQEEVERFCLKSICFGEDDCDITVYTGLLIEVNYMEV